MAADCLVIKRNLGPGKCNIMPGLFKALITAPRNFSLSAANSVLKAQWQNALLDTPAKRLHLFPRFKDLKESSEADVYQKTDLATQFVRFGRYEFDISIIESLYLHKALQTHSGNATQLSYLIDVNNRIWGYADSSNNFIPYEVELLQAEKMKINTGKEPSVSPIKVVLADATQLNVNGAYVDAQSFFTSLLELVDVDLAEVGVLAGTTLKLTVKSSSDGTSIDGLVAADFSIKSAAGVVRVITACVQDATTGVYTLTVTALAVTDVVNLVAPSALTVVGYESTGSFAAA